MARQNDRCPCGSGKKYKRCHGAVGASESKRGTLAMVVVGVILAAGIGVMAYGMVEKAGSTDMVWSEEHGHWHGPDGRELGAGAVVPNPTGAPIPQPPGDPPPGKVWSPEHGHWHDQ